MKRIFLICFIICMFTQNVFAVGITGKTKEEAIYKWDKHQKSERIKNNGIICELVKEIQRKNLQQYVPYIMTPLGKIKKEIK